MEWFLAIRNLILKTVYNKNMKDLSILRLYRSTHCNIAPNQIKNYSPRNTQIYTLDLYLISPRSKEEHIMKSYFCFRYLRFSTVDTYLVI